MISTLHALTEVDETRLRSRIGQGEHNVTTLAEEFGCSPGQVAPFVEISKLHQSLRLYRALVDALTTTKAATTLIVWTRNMMGTYHRVEDFTGLEELIGSVPEKPTLDWWLSHVHPEDREGLISHWKMAIEVTGKYSYAYRIRRKDGEWRFVTSRAAPVRNDDGTVDIWAGVTIDVTEPRTIEEQLRQSQKMDAIGQLAGGVAHDFNNLLTVIIGCNELLHKYVSTDKQALDLMSEIKYASQRAAGLTQQLLAFSRKAVIAPRVLNLNDIVREMARMLNRMIGEDITLDTQLATEPAFIRADRGQLEQVLMNLAVNARDAMPTGGQLTVKTGNVELDENYARTHANVLPGKHVLLAVSDTGCGMSSEVQARIFEPFFTTKRQGKGTGLGLATVYGIVQQAGGHMTVHSEIGHGTCFIIYLPGVEANLANANISSSREPIKGGYETILLVEDEASVRAFACRVLQLSGYTVLEASNGLEALQKLTEYSGRIDLLLTDVIMPGFSGRILAERLTKIYPAMKVLFISGYTNDAVVRHGVQQAEMQFLEKPFDLEALKQKVREVLDLDLLAKKIPPENKKSGAGFDPSSAAKAKRD